MWKIIRGRSRLYTATFDMANTNKTLRRKIVTNVKQQSGNEDFQTYRITSANRDLEAI